MASYEGWKVGDYAIRKNRLCRILKIHFDEFPPHVTVHMLDSDSVVGTEFNLLRRPTEEEMASIVNVEKPEHTETKPNENPNVNIVENTAHPTDIDMRIGENNDNNSDNNDIKDDPDINIGEANSENNSENNNGNNSKRNINVDEIQNISINSPEDTDKDNNATQRTKQIPKSSHTTSTPQLKQRKRTTQNNNTNNKNTHINNKINDVNKNKNKNKNKNNINNNNNNSNKNYCKPRSYFGDPWDWFSVF